jgi:hypothetical protein
MRRKGVCNCPFKSGKGVAMCALDEKHCRVSLKGSSICCRGWLPNGKPSQLQLSYLQNKKLF